jgi:hypothetical protein
LSEYLYSVNHRFVLTSFCHSSQVSLTFEISTLLIYFSGVFVPDKSFSFLHSHSDSKALKFGSFSASHLFQNVNAQELVVSAQTGAYISLHTSLTINHLSLIIVKLSIFSVKTLITS